MAIRLLRASAIKGLPTEDFSWYNCFPFVMVENNTVRIDLEYAGFKFMVMLA